MKKFSLLGLCIIAVVIYFALTNTQTAPKLQTTSLKKQDLVLNVNAVGKIYANNIVSVATLANGEIKELFIKEGDELKKGDIIAVLDDVNELGSLQSAKARLANLIDEVASTKANLELAKAKLKSSQKLAASGGKSYEQLLDAKANAAAAKSRYSAANAELIRAKINIKTLQKALDDTIVRSPINGVAIAVYATAGQTINSRQSSPVLAKIADISKLQVRMKIAQNDASKLKAGQIVNAFSLAEPNKKFSAKLESIDQADTSIVDGIKESSTSYYARYFLKPNESLKIGMDVQNQIQTELIKDAYVLPINYIKHSDDGYYVNILMPDKSIIKQPIKIGKSDEFNVQILSGLKPTDTVVLDD